MRAYALRCIAAGEPARAVARRLRLAPGTVASWCHRLDARRARDAARLRARAALVELLARVAGVTRRAEDLATVDLARRLSLTRSGAGARALADDVAVRVASIVRYLRSRVFRSIGDAQAAWARAEDLLRAALAEAFAVGLLVERVEPPDVGAGAVRGAA